MRFVSMSESLKRSRAQRDRQQVGAGNVWVVGASLTAAALSIAVVWGFTVDDALISVRVAHHLASELGYRFNANGPVVDAVTPLGWAYVLSPFSATVWSGLAFARWSGVACTLAAAGVLAQQATREIATGARWLVPVIWGCCLPLAAWAGAGMETAWIVLLGTLALRGTLGGACAAGWAAAWRPELLPWAAVLHLGLAWGNATEDGRVRAARVAGRLGCVLGFPLAVVVSRVVAFDDPAPLAVYAKPSDVSHGAYYLWGALRFSVAPILVAAPLVWARLPLQGRVILAASAVHAAVLVAAGGDWMPIFRLWTPVLPGLVLVSGMVWERAHSLVNLARLGTALGLSAVLWVQLVPASRNVLAARERMASGLAALMPAPGVVAGLDVGWIGASTAGTVVDLAGVTDPHVAVLPGGHTSKHLPSDFLVRRGVETLVLLLADGEAERLTAPGAGSAPAPGALRYARTVEQRVTQLEGFEEFTLTGVVPIPGTGSAYLVLSRVPAERTAHRVRSTPDGIEQGFRLPF